MPTFSIRRPSKISKIIIYSAGRDGVKLPSLKRIQAKESFEDIIADLTVRFVQEEIGLKLP
jgi:hypothetical protein